MTGNGWLYVSRPHFILFFSSVDIREEVFLTPLNIKNVHSVLHHFKVLVASTIVRVIRVVRGNDFIA